MLPDEMEAEKNRKIILTQANDIEIYQKNIKDLQEQLNAAHKKIAALGYKPKEWQALLDRIDQLEEQLDSAQRHNKNLTQSLSNAYDDISNLIKEDLECR